MNAPLQGILAASASFFVVTLFFALLYLVCQKRKKPKTQQTPANRRLSSVTVEDSASFDPSLRIDMKELIEATRNFHPDGVIGDGGFGLVYKARLANGVTVAVKKLSRDAFQGFREFRAEMETLGKINHRNLVRILGYCVSGEERILIYEFFERGGLDQWIHDTCTVPTGSSSTVSRPLSWKTRTEILKGVASGLAFLHDECEPIIIHRDIKASNVLLDTDFEAHITDFGLARTVEAWHSHVSTQVAGTMGYMPPEYKDGFSGATTKADVYSFGILMLEVATGKPPNWPLKIDGKELRLIEWARKLVEEEREVDMIDPVISDQRPDDRELKEFFRIACLCTSEFSRVRPTMGEVVTLLNQL